MSRLAPHVNAIGREQQPLRRKEVEFQTAILALVVLVAAGVLAALLPAAKAAAVNPIVALQDE